MYRYSTVYGQQFMMGQKFSSGAAAPQYRLRELRKYCADQGKNIDRLTPPELDRFRIKEL